MSINAPRGTSEIDVRDVLEDAEPTAPVDVGREVVDGRSADRQ